MKQTMSDGSFCSSRHVINVKLGCRVYHRSASEEDMDFIAAMEAKAVEHSILTTALSRSDADYIRKHLLLSSSKGQSTPVEVCLSLPYQMFKLNRQTD